MSCAIEFKEISKSFGSVRVLNNISFQINQGEFHALIGENGAGKSTLLNILHGIYSDYDGSFEIFGVPKNFGSVSESIRYGVSKVHQELHMLKNLTVGQNIFLGYEPLQSNNIFISEKELYDKSDEILQKLGCNFNARDSLESLSVGELQMIAIAKALFHNAKIISFDEPTASLSKSEIDHLFKIIEDLKSQKITIIYVSHRMEEIFQYSDKITILRDGEHITTIPASETNPSDIIEKMTGKSVNAFAQRVNPFCARDEVILEVKNLSRKDIFENISFSLRKGEILGFSGLIGAKRTDVMRTIFGADTTKGVSGEIYLNGQKISPRSPLESTRLKIAYISENRKTEGFVKNTNNFYNIAMSSLGVYSKFGFVKESYLNLEVNNYINKVNLSPPDGNKITSNLSGGNQQKVVIAKWLATKPDILILDEPTKGIDINAKAQIYKLLEDLAALGIGIILVSSEIQEILGLCDRAIVMYEGKQMTTIDNTHKDFTQESILNYAFGGH